MSVAEFRAQVQEIAAQYPDSKSAVLPALTPAYCEGVASFYDMFHLEPVGRQLVEVCTNVSCALVGAQEVLEAFESELGVRAGGTTDDGAVTLRTIEVVAVNHRYREPVRPEDVPAIVEEVRGAG